MPELELRQNIPDMNNDIIITEKEVENEIKNLDVSKSKGPDNIHPRLIKELKAQLVKPLTTIFNQSLVEGVLPSEWKKASVTPIYKGKGKNNLAANYRPISLTSIVCKTMEKIIRTKISLHIKNNNLLSKHQFGFTEKRSTTLQLLNITDEWSRQIDENFEINVGFPRFYEGVRQGSSQKIDT